jgi:hypothetical protein
MNDPSQPISAYDAAEARRAARDAYAHAQDAFPRHSVDVIDAPVLTRRSPRRPKLASFKKWAPRDPDHQRIDHAFVDPASTAFKVGFGLSAGAWLFRLILTFAAGALLFFGLVVAIG